VAGKPRIKLEAFMDRSIILATDVEADRARVFEILSTTQGQRGFWTADCEVSGGRARFGFPQAPVDLLTEMATEPDKLVRMRVTAGFPFWEGSTWEWQLGEPARAPAGTGVLFRHYGFGAGYAEIDFAHTAQTWALILARLAGYAASGQPQPFFPAPA
jgi:hypothetical protein